MKSVQIRSFFWSVFCRIRTEYGEILRISPYAVRMRQNTDQKKLCIWTLFTHAVYYTLFDGSKKNELGYNLTTSSNKATRIWSIACEWKYPITNKPLPRQTVTGLNYIEKVVYVNYHLSFLN